MLQSAILMWLCLLAVSADSLNTFYKSSSTQKPDNVPFEDNSPPKPRKLPHISEFTDPNTGLNPFIDVEEGRTSVGGRNVMKDPPFPYFEPIEGDGQNRRWNPSVLEDSKEKKRPVVRWSSSEDTVNKDDASSTTETIEETISELPFTTTEDYTSASSGIEVSLDENSLTDQKLEKTVSASSISSDSIIYATATVIMLVVLALLVGACWWRRRVKRTRGMPVAVQNGELKC